MPTITIEPTRLSANDKRKAHEAAVLISTGKSLPDLPRPLLRIVGQVLETVATSGAQPKKSKFTTSEAADYLNVSRPYVVKLMEEGKLQFHRVGTHRRVHFKDLEAYKTRQDETSRQAMEELTRLSEEMGLYELTPLPYEE